MKSNLNAETLDFLPWAVMIFNAEMKISYANAAARRKLVEIETNPADFLTVVNWVDHLGTPLSVEKHPVVQCIKRRENLSGVVLGVVLSGGREIVWMETHCIPEMEEGSQQPEKVIFTFVTKEHGNVELFD